MIFPFEKEYYDNGLKKDESKGLKVEYFGNPFVDKYEFSDEFGEKILLPEKATAARPIPLSSSWSLSSFFPAPSPSAAPIMAMSSRPSASKSSCGALYRLRHPSGRAAREGVPFLRDRRDEEP